MKEKLADESRDDELAGSDNGGGRLVGGSHTAKTAQHAGEGLTRGILDSVVVGVVRFAKDGRSTFLNAFADRFRGFTGLTAEAPSLADFERFTIWPDGSPCRVEDYPATKCFETGLPQGPTTIGLRAENGDTTWVTISVVPEQDSASGMLESVIATFVDVTHARQVEESLRQSDDRYRRLVEKAPDAIVVHRDSKIVFLNDAAVKLWAGSGREDFIGRSVLDFVHPRDKEMVKTRVRQIQAGASAPLVDQLHVRLDGRKVRVAVTGMPCAYNGQPSVQVILRDVTRRRRVERQVRRQREILRKFFDRIPVFVAIFDPSGRIKMVNREWKRVLGWEAGLTLPELLERCYPDPRERQQAADHMRTAPAGWMNATVRVRDGRTRNISCAVISLSDSTRIAIGQDVTDRKKAEAALRQNKTVLEQRVRSRTYELLRKNEELQYEVSVRRQAETTLHEKQEILKQMLDTFERDRQLVAYEIHDTFLQDVVGALMYLDSFHDSQSETGGQGLEQIERSRSLLRDSIGGARRMISGLRPPIIDEQGVVAAIEYLVSELNAQDMNVRLEHELHVERFAPVVEAALFRIVQEALTNVQRHSQSKFAQVVLKQRDATLRLEVRDFGVGFDTDSVGGGHFGLQGIRERARLLGGTASIQSAPGEGTEIVVEVPIPTTTNAAESGTPTGEPGR